VLGTQVPIRARPAPRGARIAASTCVGRVGRHEREQLALVGDLQRVEPEQAARVPTSAGIGRSLDQLEPDPDGLRRSR
jgi:hypothetical protein